MPTEPNSADISVIIVNWNSVQYLSACLTSILANRKDQKLDIIVIDNASYDGSEELVQQQFSEVRFMQSATNLGFAGASNLAAKTAKSDLLLFLNPDTEVIGDALTQLAHTLRHSPEAGLVGPKLLNSDGTVQTSCVQAFPTILNQVVDAEVLRRRFPRLSIWGNRTLLDAASNPTAVDVVSGAALMIRREVFEHVGRFTDDYFMYAEDVDLCFKVRQQGLRNYYAGSAVVLHHGGGSSASATAGFASVTMRKSIAQFLTRTRGRYYANAYKFMLGLVAIGRLMLLGGTWLVAKRHFRAQLRIGLQRWTKIFAWAVGFEAERTQSKSI